MAGTSGGSETAYEILRSLRQIKRAMSLHSRKLASEVGLTVPQLLCLKAIAEAPNQELSPGVMAQQIQVTPGTVTGITDRLVKLGLIDRQHRPGDRRRVYLTLTERGQQHYDQAPKPFQERFIEHLEALDDSERAHILDALHTVVQLMDAGDLSDAPLLNTSAKPRLTRRSGS